MDNSYEYNFNNTSAGPLPEKIKLDGNEYLFPMNNDIYDILFNALELYEEKEDDKEIKLSIKGFHNSIADLGKTNLLGRIMGYYLIKELNDLKLNKKKKIRIEIKLIEDSNE